MENSSRCPITFVVSSHLAKAGQERLVLQNRAVRSLGTWRGRSSALELGVGSLRNVLGGLAGVRPICMVACSWAATARCMAALAARDGSFRLELPNGCFGCAFSGAGDAVVARLLLLTDASANACRIPAPSGVAGLKPRASAGGYQIRHQVQLSTCLKFLI